MKKFGHLWNAVAMMAFGGLKANATEFDTEMGEDMGALMEMGYTDMGAGRVVSRGRVRPTQLRAMPQTAPPAIRARPPIVSAVEGINGPAQKRGRVPLGTVTFTAISAQTGTLTGTPQRPCRGRRLQLIVLRTAGSAAIGINVTSKFSGMVPEGGGLGNEPAETYGPLVPDNVDLYSPIGPGINFTVNLAVVGTIPAAPESVIVSGTLQADYIG